MMLKKWNDAYYIGYFQANTNTYADVNTLREKYETILKLDNVVGLSIATRSDAISDECLEYLTELNKKTFLTIELGLQSMHNDTLRLINRGHDLKNFENCVKKLKERNIRIVVHIINGLPFETKEMMIDTVKYLNSLNIDGIKIFNDAFSNIVVTIIKDILSKINIIAGKFIIVYFILVVIYAIIILSQKKEENQNN